MATTISGSSNSSFGGTIDAGSEHLTLNAVGAGKAVKLQNNGTTAVEISNGATYIKGSVYPEVSLKMNDSKAITFGNASDVEMAGGSLGTDINIKDNRLRIMNNLAELVRFPSTGGITFNGDTAAANALDDYEEGTWTPVPICTHICGSWSITGYTSNSGSYTKIGNIVQFYFKVTITGWTGTPSNMGISGLPYAASIYQSNTGTAQNHDTGILYNQESISAGGTQINVIRKYDNGNWVYGSSAPTSISGTGIYRVS